MSFFFLSLNINFLIILDFPILAEKMVQVTNEEQHIPWEEYGLRLHIPHDALPEGQSHSDFKIAVSLSGNFLQLPENSVLASAVYSFTHDLGDRKLRNPVTLEIQHCAESKALSGLQILRANDHSNKFEIIPGGDFSYDDHYGAIKLDHFSNICIGWVKKILHSTFSRRYRAKLYYTDIRKRSFKVKLYILPHCRSAFRVRIE